ncbi:histidine phosphatase family protein [Peptostreptococcus sp. D1]|uniref:histidine phosphatase family protein n=1 Tax=Peptostreptococcus sp. D1 TaxID=72304 RepID=UPI0008F221B8|nr:histidine phosphatase family protein [Peptostreptococcus sp. D1]SFE42518.1 probable phosphoglycerate mutase [Peptostreptococcus sp. D1]
MNNTYYLVRHGETEWNTMGRTQGHGDSPLTELGIVQAENAAIALSKFPIDMIYCSDLGRAVQTAEIIGKKLNKEVIATESLREMGFGEWEGMKIKNIQEKFPAMFGIWRNSPDRLDIKGAENLFIVKERQDKLIEELNEKYSDKHILLVSHSVTVRVMLLSFLDSHVRNIYRIKQDNTAINIVESRSYGPVIIKMNDTKHLSDLNIKSSPDVKSALE